MENSTFRIIRINRINQIDVISSGFTNPIELDSEKLRQETYHNAKCSEIVNGEFTTDFGYKFKVIPETKRLNTLEAELFIAKHSCKDCMGTGSINHNGSNYQCSHGVGYERSMELKNLVQELAIS